MSTTITSLLNSLHSHLQSQTQLLPTLHNQLGLPPTALADDLSTLERQLTECVESQVSARRKQVDEWMCRCDEVENCCIRYSKALGNHVKATGSSIGEIRKEKVLPRRHEMITEYQEKLRQLYHTKLEQLLTLTNRIAALSRTLGPQFYPSQILDPVIADGEDEIEPDAHRDVTPERFSKLEKELVRGKSEVGKRLHHLSCTLVQIDYLYAELGIVPPSPDDAPSTSTGHLLTRPSSSSGMLCTSSDINDPFLCASVRASTPTPASRGKSSLLFTAESTLPDTTDNEYQRIFSTFVSRIEELGDEQVQDPAKPSVGLEGVDPTPGLISWAERTRVELEDLKRKRESHIQAMYDQLETLWKRMSVSEADMDAFVEGNMGSNEDVIRAYEEELDRMLELKRERMSTFVENARAEITKLWDDLMVGEAERADFAPMADDEHTEDLLSIHEEEIRRLKEERRLKGTLLTNIKKYLDICQEEKDLAAAASDQTRLLGRGPRDPGRLLREEKMRKRVTKEKPRLQQDLLASIPAWEAETGRTFLVNGESILQMLQETSAVPEMENSKRKTRAGSAPPRSKTPSNPPNHYAPPVAGPSKPAATPAVRSTSSMSRTVPSKRAKLGESTNSLSESTRTLRSASAMKQHRAASPPRTANKPFSSLPRATPVAMPAPRHASQGVGRAPSTQRNHARGYHPYPQTHRTAAASRGPASSAARSTSMAVPTLGVMGSVALNSGMGVARKASRARRESFKPRPSVDNDWGAPTAAGGNDGPKRFAGFAGGTVQEEYEGF